MTARISLIRGKARGHRPRLQFVALWYHPAPYEATPFRNRRNAICNDRFACPDFAF
jgi:hypothetical protein